MKLEMYDLHYPLQITRVRYDRGHIQMPLILFAAFNVKSIFQMIYREISRRNRAKDNNIRLRWHGDLWKVIFIKKKKKNNQKGHKQH